MESRGPDDAGTWFSVDGSVGLSHRRLAIIDPGPGGHQPMQRDDIVITYNGEIYNFRALKKSLAQRGFEFTTQSDTEILLALYQDMGMDLVHQLEGMYALSIWDDRKKTLFLARDPYGIKPLYYSYDGNNFRFASQVKSLMSGGAVSRETDPRGEVAFLMLGSVPEPYTFYTEISALPAGSTLKVDHSGCYEPVHFCSVREVWEKAIGGCVTEDEAEIGEAFRSSVQRHLESDVPVGLFLSAGIDSGSIAGIMSESNPKQVKSVNIRFEEFGNSEYDESTLASEIADYYGLEHTERTVTKAEFDDDLVAFLDAMDQPTIDGLNSWFASKAAAERGLKVVMSGVGGDELLGSYPSFNRIPTWNRLLNWTRAVPQLGQGFTQLSSMFPGNLVHPKFWGMLKYGHSLAGGYFLNRGIFMPWELPSVMDRDRLQQGISQFDVMVCRNLSVRCCVLCRM